MKNKKEDNNRRMFLKNFGVSTIPFLLPTIGLGKIPNLEVENRKTEQNRIPVNFVYDGPLFSPGKYLEKLNEINKSKPIEPDWYGNGGETKNLENEFSRITGKEKAIYLPTGTMANQLAIKLLSGIKTKVIVPENSHIFRDEADAAQSIHNKRLVPIGKGKAFYDLGDLKTSIDYLNTNEAFKSGLGTVVIENPIRRADGTAMPIEIIKEVSNFCKQNNYSLHLDGARIFIASAYTNVSVLEYASYFDTIYISLYKYLNASGGAVLCGSTKLIEQISHQIKIHGGTVFQNWNNTSIALHYLKGIEKRWENVVTSSKTLMLELNKINGITIEAIENGTNIYDLQLKKEINYKEFKQFLYNKHNIKLGWIDEKGILKFTVNESLLTREVQEIVKAFKEGCYKVRR